MAINMDNVSDETKQWLKEHPEQAPAVIGVAEKLQEKWKKE